MSPWLILVIPVLVLVVGVLLARYHAGLDEHGFSRGNGMRRNYDRDIDGIVFVAGVLFIVLLLLFLANPSWW